jgi:ribose 5-phosphate isomerase B
MKAKLAIGADHAGFEYKEAIKKALESQGYEVKDFGTHTLLLQRIIRTSLIL